MFQFSGEEDSHLELKIVAPCQEFIFILDFQLLNFYYL